ncbi:MAG: hypothetical protein AAF492_18510 [Verrucomicrobiota bacterium]
MIGMVCLIAFASPKAGVAQNVELLFSNADIQPAMDLKKRIKAKKLRSFNAQALYNVSTSKREGYLNTLRSTDVIVIKGNTAAKAANEVPFAQPVVIVSASGTTPSKARGKLVRVVESSEKVQPGAARVVSVSDPSRFSLATEDPENSMQLIVKCSAAKVDDMAVKIIEQLFAAKP